MSCATSSASAAPAGTIDTMDAAAAAKPWVVCVRSLGIHFDASAA